MSTSRRPRPGRSGARRAAGARPGTGRPARPARPSRSSAATSASRRSRATAPRVGSPLTSRAALLGLVVCTLVFSAVLPLRTFLDQRAEIAELEREQAAAQERVTALEDAKRQLDDPAFIAAEARRRLHMAHPGEVSYVLITPSPAPVAPDAGDEQAPTGLDSPWWSQVWSSLAEADAAGQPAQP